MRKNKLNIVKKHKEKILLFLVNDDLHIYYVLTVRYQ